MNNIDTSTIVGKIAVMQAAMAGSNIEMTVRWGGDFKGTWCRCSSAPSWNWLSYDYRIRKLDDDELIVLSYHKSGSKEIKTTPFFTHESANRHADYLRREGYTVTYLKYKQVKE